MTKNLLGLLALLTVLSAPASAQMGRADGKFKQPIDANGVKAQNLDFVGVAVDTANSAGTVTPNQGSGVARTTARLWFSGEGVLYDVVVASGAATEIVHCFDAASASETSYQTTTISLLAMVQRIATKVARYSDGARAWPQRIRAGLVCDSTDNNPYFPVFEKK